MSIISRRHRHQLSSSPPQPYRGSSGRILPSHCQQHQGLIMMIIVLIVVVIVIVSRRTVMKIEVFYMGDRTMRSLTVSKTSTVLDVKTAVMDAGCCIPIANQQLKRGRRILLDDDPLSLYKIKTGTVLWLERIPTPPALHAPSVQMAPALLMRLRCRWHQHFLRLRCRWHQHFLRLRRRWHQHFLRLRRIWHQHPTQHERRMLTST